MLLTLTPQDVRRLAIAKQRLAAPPAPSHSSNPSHSSHAETDAARILSVARDLGCLQLDPTSAVARSHLLVLWSRLGVYDPAALDSLLWQDRALFEYWAHAASLVLTEDYPIHALRMRTYREEVDDPWFNRVNGWMAHNHVLHQHILDELRARGALRARDIEDRAVKGWESSGWTKDRNVDRMLAFLWARGEVMVVGRQGGQKLWGLPESFLPDWTPRHELSEREVTYHAAQKSLRALGVARPRHIEEHFTRGRYPGLVDVLTDLEREGKVTTVEVRDENGAWPGPWYVHADDLPLLEQIQAGAWAGRTTLLSPFDNLICDRARTELLWDFRFRLEIYVPKEKREYGFFVLPILHGDRLIGRVDPTMDRKARRLTVNAVYAEPDAPSDDTTARAIRAAIEDLARFVGAQDIVYAEKVPTGWRAALR